MIRNYFCFALILAGLFSYSQRGNYKFNNFGNRSILLSGNVTGSVSDIGLAYYNPAFLTDIENVGFSLNAKAYDLTRIKLDNVIDENDRLSNDDFSNAATMAGGVFNLFGTRFAYSYLTKTNYDYGFNYNNDYLNDAILNVFPDAENHNARIGINFKTKESWTGITWAKKIKSNFSLGISLFGSIYSDRGNSELNHAIVSSDNTVANYQNIIGFKQTSYGLFTKIGANYHFSKFDLGLNINLPYLEIYSEGRYNYTEIIAGFNSENDKFVDTYLKDLDATRREPLGISIGAGIPINKSKLHLNIDYVSGLSRYDRIIIPDIDTGENELIPVNFDEERQDVINFGIGLEIFITEQFMAYGGFSTDFNSIESGSNIFDLSSENSKDINIGEDFFHTSFGVDWKLKWANIITGITYTSASSKFVSPYSLSIPGFEIDNGVDANLKYSRWQFVIGIEVPIFDKKVNNILDKP